MDGILTTLPLRADPARKNTEMKNPPPSNQAHHSDLESRDENLPPIKSDVETRRYRPPAHPLFRRRDGSKHPNFTQFRPKINVKQLETYRNYNRKVLKHLKHRREQHAYEPLDDHVVDMLARTFANWIFLEEYASKDADLLAKYSDSLSKLNRQILDLWQELDITPHGRRKLIAELKKQGEQDEKINEIYEKLIGPTGTKRPS